MPSELIARVDPELVAPLEGLLGAIGGDLDMKNVAQTRAMMDGMAAGINAEAPPIDGIDTEDRHVPGPGGAPDVAVRVYRPVSASQPLPALLWMHAGGWMIGGIAMDDLMCRQLAKDVQTVIVSIAYRLAPENPYPAAIDDCYAVLEWLATHSAELHVDRSRIAVGGASAGAGLAAGLALLARDRGEIDLCFQALIYPGLDDRKAAEAAEQTPDTLFWTRGNNLLAWRAYLGDRFGTADVPAYAAPARATDLTGLPPAYIAVGSLDLFVADDVDYARRLIEAGVATELHVYAGAYHGFDVFAPMTRLGQRFAADQRAVLKRALHG